MVPSVQHFISERLNTLHHRQLMVITGAEIWCLNQLEQLINGFIHLQPEPPSVLTCNAGLPKGVHLSFDKNTASTNNTQFRQHLGREYDIVIYNAWRGVRANALAGLSGTIKKGGLLVLLCPELDSWPEFQDEELEKRISWGNLDKINVSLFVACLVRAIKTDNKVCLLSESGFSGVSAALSQESAAPYEHIRQQRRIIEQIKKVATGHRKRPLVLTADRGRGKSAALGIAVAELVTETPKKILVTAPQKSSVETLFRHALNICPEVSDYLQFCAVDDLTLNRPDADLLVVDEAAAIPVAQLKTLSQNYHRMVFSTTTNGYEGSGRGFEVRFKPWLAEHRPDAKFATLSLPFRWFPDDCLEAFWWQTLHLKAVQPDEILSGSHLTDRNNRELKFSKISRSELFHNQALLNSIFALLVDAHYQTTPDDLVALLDAPDQHLFVLFQDQPTPENILGVLTGSIEGEITDDKLKLNIVSGQRRVQGHMLPQQLAYGMGEREFLPLRYFRVIRIAVRNAVRSRGFGSVLLNKASQWCKQNHIQLMGSSFGVTDELLRFWLHAGFTPALLGFQRDKATAEYNITVLKVLADEGSLSNHIERLQTHLQELLLFHLSNMYQNLDNKIIIQVLNRLDRRTEVKNQLQKQDNFILTLFCKHSRSLELSAATIQKLLMNKLRYIEKSKENYDLLVDYILKKRSSKYLVKRHNLKGKKQLLTELKRQTSQLVETHTAID